MNLLNDARELLIWSSNAGDAARSATLAQMAQATAAVSIAESLERIATALETRNDLTQPA